MLSHDLARTEFGYKLGLRQKKLRVANNYCKGTSKAIWTCSGTHKFFVSLKSTFFLEQHHEQKQISTSKFRTISNDEKSFACPKRTLINTVSLSENFFKKCFITWLKKAKNAEIASLQQILLLFQKPKMNNDSSCARFSQCLAHAFGLSVLRNKLDMAKNGNSSEKLGVVPLAACIFRLPAAVLLKLGWNVCRMRDCQSRACLGY